MKTVSINVNTWKKLSRIAPEIYGHFSEHLGRCIYNITQLFGNISYFVNLPFYLHKLVYIFRDIPNFAFMPHNCSSVNKKAK